jgi:hypothetical protein
MRSIRCSIRGIPFGQDKPRRDQAGPPARSDAVVAPTSTLPKVVRPCIPRVTFLLPPNKFPDDHPFGNDLDNLLKRFCDAIKQTILSDAPGTYGPIIALEATKTRVDGPPNAGAELEIIELPVG